MDNGGIHISIGTINRLFVLLLHLAVAAAAFRLLLPPLSRSFKWLAGALLAAHALAFMLALEWQPASNFQHWLRLFTEEYNLPATLASAQLALISAASLFCALLAKAPPARSRLYFAAVALVYLFFAIDEYFALHERYPAWEWFYAALGAVIVLATVAIARRSPGSMRLWHAGFLAGLALSAAGAIGFEFFPKACGGLLFIRFDDCLLFFYMEEACELLGSWLVLLAMLGFLSHWRLGSRARLFLFCLPALWLLLILLVTLVPRLELRLFAAPASVEFESGVRLHGYRVDGSLYRLYASARFDDYLGLGYSLHLVDQANAESVASLDRWASRQELFWLFGADYAPLYRQWMTLDPPPETPANRAYWLVLSLWRPRNDEFIPQKIVSSDRGLLTDTQVILEEFVIPAPPATLPSEPIAFFARGLALHKPQLPAHARAGETLEIAFAWRSETEGDEDFVQFLHLRHEESGEWLVYDQPPLGARLPTRLWYSGLADSETWHIPLPADLAPGNYALFTGLYRTRDKERLPVRDATGAPFQDASVPLGIVAVRA